MSTTDTQIAIIGSRAGRLSWEMRQIARALATGVLIIDATPPKFPEIEELVVKMPEDFDLKFIEPKTEREPWRRGRPLL